MIKKDTGQTLLRYHWKNHKFCCFDYETCNLNLSTYNVPWEVGYLTAENGNIISQHNTRIWWEDLNMSEDAARITRFDYQDYKNTAKDARETLQAFEKHLLDPQTINITYNGLGFDMYIHNLWRKKLGLEPTWSFILRSIDVLALARAYKMGLEPPDNWEEFMCWQRKLIGYFSDSRLRKERKKGFGSTTLATMAKEFGVEVDEGKTHQGLYDVILTWEIFKKMIWKMNLTKDCVLIK